MSSSHKGGDMITLDYTKHPILDSVVSNNLE